MKVGSLSVLTLLHFNYKKSWRPRSEACAIHDATTVVRTVTRRSSLRAVV